MRAWLLILASCAHPPAPAAEPLPVHVPSDDYALTPEQPQLGPDSDAIAPPDGWYRYTRPELTIWFPGHPTVADETTGVQASTDADGRFFVVSVTTLDRPAYARTPEQILSRAHRAGCEITEWNDRLAGLAAHWFRLHYRRDRRTEEIVVLLGNGRAYNLGVSMPDPFVEADARRFFLSFRPLLGDHAVDHLVDEPVVQP
jgi:hypothetical protein